MKFQVYVLKIVFLEKGAVKCGFLHGLHCENFKPFVHLERWKEEGYLELLRTVSLLSSHFPEGVLPSHNWWLCSLMDHLCAVVFLKLLGTINLNISWKTESIFSLVNTCCGCHIHRMSALTRNLRPIKSNHLPFKLDNHRPFRITK